MADAGGPQPRLIGGNAPVVPVAAGAQFYRSHHANFAPVYFGKGPTYRFDDPAAKYGVLYAAYELEGAFAETHLRKPGRRYVDRATWRRGAGPACVRCETSTLCLCTGAILRRWGLRPK